MSLSDHGEHRRNTKLVSQIHFAELGAGQIIVDRGTAFIALFSTGGIVRVDVHDPYHPRVLGSTPAPKYTSSYKVQVADTIMVVNNERIGGAGQGQAGVRIYDISRMVTPRELGFFPTGGCGVHRMWFADGRYAHIATTLEGYSDRIYMILDLSNPEKPVEVSRWWLPGMWTAGGEEPAWDTAMTVGAHGPPLANGDRVYLGWMDGGFTILDVGSLEQPRLVSRFNWSPPFGGFTHTVLPLPNRQLLVVSDEAIREHCEEREKYVWLVDVREERNPIPISTVQVETEGFCKKGGRFGPHNLHEQRPGSYINEQLIFVTYFNGGLRVIDISDKYRPKEVGYYIPERPSRQKVIQTNDVYVDREGLIYIVDRLDGVMHILEYTGPG
jgi:hypothetical protein